MVLHIIEIIGIFFMFYGAICCLKLNFQPANALPAVFGLGIFLYAYFFDEINGASNSFGKALKILINGGLIFFLITFLIICFGVYRKSQLVPEKGRDAIIVLGAGLRNGDQISLTLANRLNSGLSYYNDNPGSIFVVSGGQGGNETVSEAAAMKGYLLLQGVPEDDILLEDRSTSTLENLTFSKVVLDAHFGENNYTAVYVTNDFHALRAGFIADKMGYKEIDSLTGKSEWYMLPAYYSREYLAILWYFVSGG